MFRYKTRGRPKQLPNGPIGHWPIRKMDEKLDSEVMPRGSRKEVYARLPDSSAQPAPADPAQHTAWKPTWIKAEIFRDNRWVTLLSTSWFGRESETCKRWMPAFGERMPVHVSLAMRCYHRNFNFVDRFNKKLAAMGMGMARCKRRWQRQLWVGWEWPAITCDVFVLFQVLYPRMTELRREKRWFGLDRWLQYTGGKVLFDYGAQLDKDALGSPATRAEQGLHPAGMPKRKKRDAAPPTPLAPRDPEIHTLVDTYENPRALPKAYHNHRPAEWYTGPGQCCACQALAQSAGYMEDVYGNVKDGKPVRKRCMPAEMPAYWSHVKGGSHVPKVRTACLECSKRLKKPVWLCPACHERNNGIWNHGFAKEASACVQVG